MKKIKSIILTLVLLFSAGVFTASAYVENTYYPRLQNNHGTKPAKGNGNKGNPYEITNADELRWFVWYENSRKHYPDDYAKLMNDIDLSSLCGPNKDSWIPLGFREAGDGYGAKDAIGFFEGELDGNGCKITGMYINGDEFDYAVSETHTPIGFCGRVCDARIKNLRLEGEIVNANRYTGGLIGYIYSFSDEKVMIENCVVNVNISTSAAYQDAVQYVGGMIGYIDNLCFGTIKNCVYNGQITRGFENTGDDVQLGSFIGFCDHVARDLFIKSENYNTKLENCAAYAGGEYPFISNGTVSMDIKNCIADNCLMGTLL